MSKSKRNKVHLAAGSAWYFDKFGERRSVETLSDANEVESACCGINCCDNTITLPVNDSASDTTYPSSFEFVNVGGTIKLRVTVDLGAGFVTKEVTLT